MKKETMSRVDDAIKNIDKNICNNIAMCSVQKRGFISQNILSELRNLVEFTNLKIFETTMGKADMDPFDYSNITSANKYIKTCGGRLRFLRQFHSMLQKSVSHYSYNEIGSERLMLKYYEYLLRLKDFYLQEFNTEILNNICDFPLDTDKSLDEYYEKISERIIHKSKDASENIFNERVYIQKIKPFFINSHVYYEVTFTVAHDRVSKFDRVIAFTRHELIDNYALKLSLHNDVIYIMNKPISIQVIDSWEVSIRPCEMNRLVSIFGVDKPIGTNTREYQGLMQIIRNTKLSITDIVTLPEDNYIRVRDYCTKGAKATTFFGVLDRARELIMSEAPGNNVLRYLLYVMNNKIIKAQRNTMPCEKLSYLGLNYGCIPFDSMPFATSLIRHNPRLIDLYSGIDVEGRDCELLARSIKNNTEQKDMLFTSLEDLAGFENIDELIEHYNSKLYYKHRGRQIVKYKDYLFIQEYETYTANIIKRIKAYSNTGVSGYTAFVDAWNRENPYHIDSEEKREALRNIFADSRVALVYGAAGTGKSTFINHIAMLYSDKKKLFLANTNPAVENLRRKVHAANCEFMTIAKYLSNQSSNKSCDILFVDECSTVSNKDMDAILQRTSFALLVLVGDMYQIESILFGNWFSIARGFIKKESVFELTIPYRSTDKGLITIWNRVRTLDDAMLEPMVKRDCLRPLNDSIFESFEDDEIVLCLNYDGLYGINNVNRILQSNNQNVPITCGVNTYKINDPILFNESERFAPLIYNNMKGRIHNIEANKDRIRFEIEVDTIITDLDADRYDFTLKDPVNENKSIISFWCNRMPNTDNDNDSIESIIPFQIAYAVSIHKAQGLEYKSVKVVISHEAEEQITHNIFYTAITRAKESLKIYWSPETEQKVLSGFTPKNFSRDVSLLKKIEGWD